jgi:hypothetical protein
MTLLHTSIITDAPQQGIPVIQIIKPLLALETLALLTFGSSWLIKGKLFLNDRDV